MSLQKELLWTVDRTSTARKLKDFMDTADELQREMRHRERLAQNRFWKILTNNVTMEYLKIAVGLLSLVINIYMLLVYETPNDARGYQHMITE